MSNACKRQSRKPSRNKRQLQRWSTVDALRRIEAAKAQALQSVKRPTSLFHSFVPTEELLFFSFIVIVLTLYGFLRFTTYHKYQQSVRFLRLFPHQSLLITTSPQSRKRGAYVILTALRVSDLQLQAVSCCRRPADLPRTSAHAPPLV